MPARWSFSYPGAVFTTAKVTMKSGGKAVAVKLEPLAAGYGDNTLVWLANGLSGDDMAWPTPSKDTAYVVTVSGVLVNSVQKKFTYTVWVFNPATA